MQEKNYIQITIHPEIQALPERSRLGGGAYLPTDFPYPLNPQGFPLHLLMQFNFDEIPHIPLLPNTGLLQVYVDSIDTGGVCCLPAEDSDCQGLPIAKIIYFDSIQPRDFVLIKTNMTASPLIDPHYPAALSFTRQENVLLTACSQIGGDPYFIQEDPRLLDSVHTNKTFLLLQLVSQEDAVIWGDDGIAQVFINPENIVNRDFSDVLFSWSSY